MSATPPSTPAADGSAGCFSQSARWHCPSGGPDPPASAAAARGAGQSDGTGASPVVAVARLHRHALESVLAFLDLRELAFALRVSRGWLAAARTMRRLELHIERLPSAPLAVVAQSAMSRHVTALGSDDCRARLDAATLSLLADRMAHLRELSCGLDLPPPSQPIGFPAALRSLTVQMSDPADPTEINAVIATIGQLSLLEELTTGLPAMDPQISFAPLATLPQLLRLEIRRPWGEGEFNDAQVDQLRALPRLQELYVPTSTSLLRELLRQPRQLQWQLISLPDPFDDEAAALLPQLPSLTKIICWATCSRFDWLRGLPSLTDVYLSFTGPMGAAGRSESLVADLRCCSNIEILSLCHQLTAAHLADLLPRLPRLRELRLSCLSIASLAFLAQSPLTSQLSCLKLFECPRLPLSNLRHVHALRGLIKLELKNSFSAPLDEHSLSLLTPPSLLLPRLREFTFRQR